MTGVRAILFSALLLAGVTRGQSSPQSDGVKSISEKDAAERLVHRVEPIYPDDAREARVEGSVALLV